jgi:hypothetical protein
LRRARDDLSSAMALDGPNEAAKPRLARVLDEPEPADRDPKAHVIHFHSFAVFGLCLGLSFAAAAVLGSGACGVSVGEATAAGVSEALGFTLTDEPQS